MSRPTNRPERRAQILEAFATVLANHGYAGATIAAVATEAGMAPGLLHHHFQDKHEMLEALLRDLVSKFRMRVHTYEAEENALLAYVDGALKLDERADVTAARCWVGLFAEAVRSPSLFRHVRNLIDAEIGNIRRRSGGRLSDQDAGAVLAFIIGALVVGSFAPKKTAGFAAPGLQKLVGALATPR
ncbi:MAG: TetR family transcriptional regulator [Polyangiales bacterium]|nr:TetR family transcriptional regulator [Myxococcales bacterium]